MNGRIKALEDAFTPLMHLYLDWNEYNVMHEEDNQLTIVQYIVKTSDYEALENIFKLAYNVFKDKSEATS